MKQFIEIKADTDKNIIVKRTEITNEELKVIEPVLQAIKDFQPYTTEDAWTHVHNFPHGEYFPNEKRGEKGIIELYVTSGLCTEDQLWTFVEFCPDGELHSITDVDLIYVAHEEKLLETN